MGEKAAMGAERAKQTHTRTGTQPAGREKHNTQQRRRKRTLVGQVHDDGVFPVLSLLGGGVAVGGRLLRARVDPSRQEVEHNVNDGGELDIY